MTNKEATLKERVEEIVEDEIFNAIEGFKETGWMPSPKYVGKILKLIPKEIKKKLPEDVETVFDKRVKGEPKDYWWGYSRALSEVKQVIDNLFR